MLPEFLCIISADCVVGSDYSCVCVCSDLSTPAESRITLSLNSCSSQPYERKNPTWGWIRWWHACTKSQRV